MYKLRLNIGMFVTFAILLISKDKKILKHGNHKCVDIKHLETD